MAAVRAELEAAGKLPTVAGQLALVLAGQIERASGSATAAANALEHHLDRALGRAPSTSPRPADPEVPPAGPVDDEVTRAREERDALRRAAAG